MQSHKTLVACFFTVCALAGAGAAQADIVYSAISSSGNYGDGLVLWTKSGNTYNQRPLAQENTVRGSTGTVQDAKYRVIGGKKYLYWLNTFPGRGIYRGADGNGNGAIDASETQELFAFDAAFRGGLDERGGAWWAGVADRGGNSRGLWRLQDRNGDGDFKDTGESNQIVKGPTMSFGSPAITISTDDIRATAMMPNGDAIWYEDDVPAWFRTTAAGRTSVFLVYKSTSPSLPLNADFAAGRLRGLTGDLDRVTVDQATGTVYLTINFRASEAVILAARDRNNDGDVQDSREVTVFFDGTKATPAFGDIDDIDWMGGAVYGSYEINRNTDPGSQFFELKDKNNNGNASDPGELTKLGRTAKTDDPFMVSLNAVPAGTFGASCVNAELENNSTIKSTAGTAKFTLQDIPASLQNDNTFGFMALSVTGDAGLRLAPNCVLGITPDALTIALFSIFAGGPIAGNTLALPDLKYPAGVPVGTKVYFAGVFIRASDGTFRGVTGSGLITSIQ